MAEEQKKYFFILKSGGVDYYVKDEEARDALVPFSPSGTNHSQGLVPDPGNTAGITKFLREDGTWSVPEGGGGSASAYTPTLASAPTSSTTSYTRDGQTVGFEIGQFCRVADAGAESGYRFYQLHDLQDNGSVAVWQEIGSALERVTLSVIPQALRSSAVVTLRSAKSGVLFQGTVADVQTVKVEPGDTYTVECSDVDGFITPESTEYTAQYEGERSITLTYEKKTVVSDYIILDQTSSDPTTKVLDSAGRSYSNGYTRPAVIDQIRAASHCYVGTFASNKMTLKQLSDTDGTKYADGTSAASDIASTSKDVFMRLPIFFTRTTQVETDKWKIEFAFDPSQVGANGQIVSTTSAVPAGTGWKQWGGNDLIGKYKGYDASSKLYSISGVASTASISQANFKSHARAKGTGFSIVKWRHQNIMAILFYAYYGHTNCQQLIGTGANSRNRVTGQKNSLGMTDTTASNGNTDNIVFWGLENWWGDLYELVDNVVANNPTWTITEDDGTTRNITVTSTRGAWLYPSKFVLGDDLDVVAAPGQSGGSDSQGYCDGQYHTGTDSRVVARSCSRASTYGGVAFVDASYDSSYAYSSFGSRLAFIGEIAIS